MRSGKLALIKPLAKKKRKVKFLSRLMEVLDKGKAATVTTVIETRDKHSHQLVFENQMTVFIRGAGGFGGKRIGKGVPSFFFFSFFFFFLD